MKIYTPVQVKSIEQKAMELSFLSEDILMENAAHALYSVIISHYTKCPVTILCGPGNNGGDGLALARILQCEGWDVKISFLYPPNYKGVSKLNYSRIKNIEIVDIDNIPRDKNQLIVDALFGIGLNRELDNRTITIIKKINSLNSPVISVDIPSGIEGISGQILNEVVINATITVTFIGYKLGMFSFPAITHCGKIIVCPISISKDLLNSEEAPYLNDPVHLCKQKRNSHKCSNGKITTIGGSESYYGAPYFSSKAALLSGAGFSVLISDEKINSICAGLAPEVIYRTEKDLNETLKTATAVVIGPGIGLTDRSLATLKQTLDQAPRNLILDADALTLLSKDLAIAKKIKNTFVITPHPGEMARLTGKTIREIEENRMKSALELSIKLGAIVVLKGLFTLITTPEGEIYINNTSSITLSTAGSGDILCGIIAGLTGYNTLIDSVRAGVYIHGLAGQIAEMEIGKLGVTATDILSFIPKAINMYNSGERFEKIIY